KELWLVEGELTFINPEIISQRINKYRDIFKRYRLLFENITISSSPWPMPILKIFLDIYLDHFGTYRNVYYSLGGTYIQIGNMKQSDQKLLKNHFLIGLVLFGTDFKDFIKPVLNDLKHLENVFIMYILYRDAWIMGGIGCVTADLLQGNDLA
ncbi:14536_t:CDS:2, partial [Racocetra persica]